MEARQAHDVSLHAFFQPYFDRAGTPKQQGELLFRPADGTPADVFFHSLPTQQQFTILEHQIALQATINQVLGTQVSVNIHNRLVADDSTRQDFIELASRASAPVTFEFTETYPMPPALVANGLLRDLRSMGHRSALDDFGTGLNGVSLLTDYDFDVIKVDRTFIADLDERPDRQRTLALLHDMLAILGKDHVIEGVETSEALTILADLGFTTFQGFYFGQPILVADALEGGSL